MQIMQDFESKRNALFACLDDASKEIRGTALDQSGTSAPLLIGGAGDGAVAMVYRRAAPDHRQTLPDRKLSRMRGKESIFKKPQLPISRCLKPRKTPDFQLNPHKWTKYSLEDVDISDHTNTAAAFEFLRQMDDQRDAEEGDVAMDGGDKKIEFKKSSKIRRHLKALEATEVKDAEVDRPKLKGSKLVMPEYVVGEKKEKRKKLKVVTAERAAGTLRLAHLQEDDETEEG